MDSFWPPSFFSILKFAWKPHDDLNRLTAVTENYSDGSFNPDFTDEDVRTEYAYDAVGNRTEVTDARNNTTAYTYDALNRRITLSDPLNQVTYYGYDAIGNRTVITDANRVVTHFSYDGVNRLTDIDYDDSTPDVSFTYDNAGNRQTMTDGTGTTSYEYDDLYRLTEITAGANQTVAYGYDAVGNRTQLIYPNNQVVTYTYDLGNRLDTVTDWNNGQFGYDYDAANRLTAVALPNGVESSYTYDAAGRLTLLAHDNLTETLASYEYQLDNVGNRTTLDEELVTVRDLPPGAYLESDGLVVMEAEHFGVRINGLSHNWLLKTGQSGYTGTSYLQPLPDIDTLYQTDEITASPQTAYPIDFTTPGTYTVWLRGYPTNAAGDSAYVGLAGQVITLTGFSPFTWTWASKATPLVITSTGVLTMSLWMREDGLRIDRLLITTDTNYIPTDYGPAETGRQIGGDDLIIPLTRTIVYTYDNLYRLTNADYSTGEQYAYEYDPVGNRLQQVIDGDTTDYLYDAANRLAEVDGQSYTFDANGNLLNTGVMTNSWDAANRLVEAERDGTILEPIYNGVGDRVAQTVGTTTTNFALDVAGGLPEVIYTSEDDSYLHLPGVIMTESATGEVRYLLSDGLGSVRQATDETGTVISYYEFDPYGNPVDNSKGGEPYGYTGEWYEGYINLLHLRARWYLAETGTFLSRDAVESEPAYLYVRGNPANRIDPSGYCTPEPGQITCTEIVQTNGGVVQGTTTIVGGTSSEVFQTNGGTIQETKFTLAMCTKPTGTGQCQNLPSQQRPTLQPLITGLNTVANGVLFPLSVAGATTRFVEQGSGLHGRIVYSWNSPPQIEITPRGTIRSFPSKLANYSTFASAAIPVVIGVANTGEIQLRANAGEISSSQAGWQHGVNVVATTAGSVGGAWAIPTAANTIGGITAGAIGVTETPVLVPSGIAFVGGVCLAYDISIIQGTANRMIEGQPLWFAYLSARDETHQVMFFGYDPIK